MFVYRISQVAIYKVYRLFIIFFFKNLRLKLTRYNYIMLRTRA